MTLWSDTLFFFFAAMSNQMIGLDHLTIVNWDVIPGWRMYVYCNMYLVFYFLPFFLSLIFGLPTINRNGARWIEQIAIVILNYVVTESDIACPQQSFAQTMTIIGPIRQRSQQSNNIFFQCSFLWMIRSIRGPEKEWPDRCSRSRSN